MKPTRGRIVDFSCPEGTYAAIVAGVNADGSVDLHCFPPGCSSAPAVSVHDQDTIRAALAKEHGEGSDEFKARIKVARFWTWPARQTQPGL